MHVAQGVLRSRREHGTAQQPSLWVVLWPRPIGPSFVEAGEAQQGLLLGVQIVGDLLPVLGLLPLVVSLGGDDCTPLHGGLPEGRLLQDAFVAGVD